jgi:hypothetical protein
MADEQTDNRWRELAWRRELTAAERAELAAWLRAHAEAQADWAAEAALSGALARLGDAPVPSNFTARVLQGVEREALAGRHSRVPSWLSWRGRWSWLPKAALASLVVGVSLFSYHQVEAFQRRQIARSVAAISDVTSLPSPQVLTNFDAIRALGQTPAADLELLQAIPAASAPGRQGGLGQSPVDTFRELLARTPGERKQLVAGQPAETQRLVLAKAREYESLKPNQREVRLAVTELYYYLWPLLNTPATNRAARLARVPDRLQVEIAQRLQLWDDLAPGKQRELLTNAVAAHFFARIRVEPPMPPAFPAQWEKLQRGFRQWQALSVERRQQIMTRFYRFFDLTDEEKAQALSTLSEPERQQIEKTLRRFANLSPGDRAECLMAFEKFASLSVAERAQFLKNAERWKLMTPAEREDWRRLVGELPEMPPMPPGFRSSPPMPPGFRHWTPPRPPGGVGKG